MRPDRSRRRVHEPRRRVRCGQGLRRGARGDHLRGALLRVRSVRVGGLSWGVESGTTARALANDGIYPGLYYAVMGFAVGDEPVNSALLARTLSWTICVGFLAGGWSVLPRRHRAGYLIMLLVTSIPSALSLWTSTNPSGVVVAAIAAAWCAVIALVHADDRRERVVAGILLAAALVAAAGSRADGGVYAFVAVIAAGALLWRRGRDRAQAVIAAGVAAGLALLVSVLILNRRVVGVDQLVTQVDGAGDRVERWPAVEQPARDPVLPHGQPRDRADRHARCAHAPDHLGLDAGSVLRPGVLRPRTARPRKGAVAGSCVLVGLLGIPYFLLWRGGYPVGFEVAARYALPLVPVLGFTLLYWRRATSVASLTVAQLSTVLALMSIAHSVALHSTIRRYVTGVGNLSLDLDAGASGGGTSRSRRTWCGCSVPWRSACSPGCSGGRSGEERIERTRSSRPTSSPTLEPCVAWPPLCSTPASSASSSGCR